MALTISQASTEWVWGSTPVCIGVMPLTQPSGPACARDFAHHDDTRPAAATRRGLHCAHGRQRLQRYWSRRLLNPARVVCRLRFGEEAVRDDQFELAEFEGGEAAYLKDMLNNTIVKQLNNVMLNLPNTWKKVIEVNGLRLLVSFDNTSYQAFDRTTIMIEQVMIKWIPPDSELWTQSPYSGFVVMLAEGTLRTLTQHDCFVARACERQCKSRLA